MKKLFTFLLLISLSGLTTCLILNLSYYEFNPSHVKSNIEYFSSKDFKGRLAGSGSNEKVGNEIEKTFKNYKLKTLGNDYKESFNVMIPTPNDNKCSLKLLNGSDVIQSYILGVDFKEDFLNFKNPSISFSNKDRIDIYPKSFSIFKDNIEYLFYVTFDSNFSFRSSFSNNSNYGFVIQINTSTFNSLLDSLRQGYTLQVNLPYTVHQQSINNIIGKIEGSSNSLPPLILTAHYDHIGTDSLNNVYYGALDNASGISFLLELAKNFSTLKTPKRDIIFVALNGEELGLLGSKYFASEYKDSLAGAEVINFDMIGIDKIPITLMSGENCNKNSSNLLNSLEDICKDKKIDFTESYHNSSDHAEFIKNGFDSLTISTCDSTNIHTPKDTADKISTIAIKNTYELVGYKIINYAYNDFFLIFYNFKTLVLFSLSSFLLIGFKIFYNYKNKYNNN
ncbi:M28 family metallopeptidase [Clostridium sp. SHJSY1]|uniref:M28 family metallopeptidase n=1 Tax=Clostridium sp. SHJSY1 TaxID=2942483 RepID=UPI0028754F79|nr:M28 family metallopeptidase [Clostridium sp. SHJSY1]MDS0526623.1 M28 family metallopeptidase [Clostridium sp. SHJSY1]